jgi:hypothetical protein
MKSEAALGVEHLARVAQLALRAGVPLPHTITVPESALNSGVVEVTVERSIERDDEFEHRFTDVLLDCVTLDESAADEALKEGKRRKEAERVRAYRQRMKA